MGGGTTTTQKNDPWGPSQPYIMKGLKSAGEMWDANPNQFVMKPWEGDVVSGEDPAQKAARDQMLAMTQGQGFRGIVAQNQTANAREAGYGNQRTSEFNQGIKGAFNPMNTGPNADFARVGQQESNAGPNQWAMQGMGLGMKQGNDPRFNFGVNQAQHQANASGFDRAINNMTGDGYDQQLRDQLRSNVNEDVMPGMNATFGSSGMTGSGLHQQNLAKGLSSGMARQEAEFLNRAQDRQFAAGQASQDALMNTRAMGLQAGSAAQQAQEASRQRALAAGGLGLDISGQQSQRRIAGANMGQQGMLDQAGLEFQRRAQGLQAGQMGQDALLQNRAQGMQAAGMNAGLQQAAYNPYQMAEGIGAERRGDSQKELAAKIMAFQQNQAGPVDAINNYLSLMSGLGGQFGQSMSKSQQNPGLFGILGGLGQMFPFF